MSNFIKITVLTNDGICDRGAMLASLEAAMDQEDATAASAYDVVESALTAYLQRNPDLKSFPVATLVTRAHEAATATIRAGGGDDDAVDEALTRLKETVPNFLKSRPEAFHVGKGRGVSIRERMTAEEWTAVLAPPVKKDAKKGAAEATVSEA